MDLHRNSFPSSNDTILHFGPYHLEGVKRLWCERPTRGGTPATSDCVALLGRAAGPIYYRRGIAQTLMAGHLRDQDGVTSVRARDCDKPYRMTRRRPSLSRRWVAKAIGSLPLSPLLLLQCQLSVGSCQFGHRRNEAPTDWAWRTGNGPTPFVGRAQELARLQEVFDRAQQGERQIVFLFGEPGIGKTTLVDRFLDQVRRVRHVRIGRGQCVEHYGSGEAYLPLLEALGTVMSRAGW